MEATYIFYLYVKICCLFLKQHLLLQDRAALSFQQTTKINIKGDQKIRLHEILSATNHFSDDNLIKVGGLGKLYRGKLFRSGMLMDIVARRLSRIYGQGDIEFRTEISVLSSLENNNISSVVGFVDEKDEKIIVYEQKFYGCLDQHIGDPTLRWSQRLQICLGVAHALNYIHYDVIHCDINSSKIFLDEAREPKIFGFEFSTKFPQSWRHRLLYSSYFHTSSMTPKFDVYCFGVLMFEILCGRKPMIKENVVIEEVHDIIDPNLLKQMDTQSLNSFLKTARACLKKALAERPTMDQVVKELEETLELQSKHQNPGEGASTNHSKVYFLKIPLREIKLATNDFDQECCVGAGGYGTVYRAILDVLDIQDMSSLEGKCKDELPKISKIVAIKRISREDEQGKEGFLSEIELLTSCRHPNIVSLLGFSEENREMVLVYEYVSNGSLCDCIEKAEINLTWAQRLQISLDIANGINYLHTDMEGKPRILHRDIKSQNILLDENLNAKVADFGLSKFHPKEQQASTIFTARIAGTLVYLDPEYLATGNYKKESDVYSFGIVLFEILSGRLAFDNIYMEKGTGLGPIARRRFNEKTLKELIDPKMLEDNEHSFTLNRGPNQESFDAFSEIAYQCLAETQAKRPTMELVIKELKNALKLQGKTMVLSRFPLSDIVSATENFSETYCIGIYAYGMVYKAKVDHFGNKGILVAVKRISSRESAQGEQRFFSEIEMHAIYTHPNVVSLVGYCDERDELILLYEHASNNSLDDYLKSVDNVNNLTWTQRLQMCLDIAQGLDHIHTKMDCQQHGDIRSSNILLGKNGETKIAYFGSSKLHPSNQEVGVKVYWDPEYEKTYKLEKESDVYSFGVVMLEIFCGRVAYDPGYIGENEKGLAPIARRCFNRGTIKKMIDPKLLKVEETDDDIFTSIGRPNQKSLDTFLEIANNCLRETQAGRPTLDIVIKELEKALNFQDILKNLRISLKDIRLATQNFSHKNCDVNARYWKTYKGQLSFPQDNVNNKTRIGTPIVAKRWDTESSQGYHQFCTEFEILFKCREHENIIGLVGFCNEMDEKIIVYERKDIGSLDNYLKDDTLTWTKRLKICIDVASGLKFLHEGDATLKKVVHMDIKSPNILLTDDCKANISNLECSSIGSLHQDMTLVTDNAYASLGYLDPQYKHGSYTEKSDIYSFGVVLLEILCGRLAWDERCKDHSESLGPLAKRHYEERKLDEMVFAGIKSQIHPEALAIFADIAYGCLHDKLEERPTVHEVKLQLENALHVQETYNTMEAIRNIEKEYTPQNL
ncbi:hypothetical protein R6Q59_024213 [Mikania micrantha]